MSKGISIFLNASSFHSIYNYSDQRQRINGTIYINDQITTARKMSKYQVFSGPYFPISALNTVKYVPEKSPHVDPFYAVNV